MNPKPGVNPSSTLNPKPSGLVKPSQAKPLRISCVHDSRFVHETRCLPFFAVMVLTQEQLMQQLLSDAALHPLPRRLSQPLASGRERQLLRGRFLEDAGFSQSKQSASGAFIEGCLFIT